MVKYSERIIQDKLHDLILNCRLNPMNERNLVKDFCSNNFIASCGQFIIDNHVKTRLSNDKITEIIKGETDSTLCRMVLQLKSGLFKKEVIEHSVRSEEFGRGLSDVHDLRLFVVRLK
jgi:hypothetical protein